MFKFTINARLPNGRGRAGLIETANGIIETPAFIPVATKATIKALTPEQVRDDVGAAAILANTYHLYLQPGIEAIKQSGGLGKFMNWSGPTFTDSGGFQAFSLGFEKGRRVNKIKKVESNGEIIETDNEASPHPLMAKVTDEGVSFRSVVDGSAHFFNSRRHRLLAARRGQRRRPGYLSRFGGRC